MNSSITIFEPTNMELHKIDDKTYSEELTLYSENFWDHHEGSCLSLDRKKFIISECGIKDSVLLICPDNIKIFDTVQWKITGQFPINNSDLKNYERGSARYVHKADKIYLSLLTHNRWKEYKLDYRY